MLHVRYKKEAMPLATIYRTFPAKTMLTHAGLRADSLYKICQGYVKLFKLTASGEMRVLDILGPGDVVGVAALTKHAYQVDAMTISSVRLQVYDNSFFAREALHDSAVYQALSQALFSAWQRFSEAKESVQVRLVKLLLQYAEKFGQQEGLWTNLALPMTHEDMASMISSSRVSVSGILSDLRQEDLISGNRGRYRLDVSGLRQYIKAVL